MTLELCIELGDYADNVVMTPKPKKTLTIH